MISIIEALSREEHRQTWSAIAEIAALILRKNSNWPEYFQLIELEFTKNTSKAAELLARTFKSSSQVC